MQKTGTAFRQPFGEGDDIGVGCFIVQIRQIFRVFNDDQLPLLLVVHEIAKESGAHAIRFRILYALVKTKKRRVNDEEARIIFGMVGKIVPEGERGHAVDKGRISLPFMGRFFMPVNLYVKIGNIEIGNNRLRRIAAFTEDFLVILVDEFLKSPSKYALG